MEELLAFLARSLVNHPERVAVESREEDGTVTLSLEVAPEDLGKVIGRQGRIARAIRTVMKAAGARDGRKVVVEIKDQARERPQG
ncbi:MAG: KH domain-containing protein [Bacillota bacterium]|nr:KH domain-containing protein [Bacillota bacterium]